MSSVRGTVLLLGLSTVLVTSLAPPVAKPSNEARGRSDAPSQVLERALKLYDSDELYSASIELYKVVEGESGDSEANKQKAEFWMGKTLYKLKYYSAALSYFDRIVQKGPSHAHYNETLKWLASLSREVADSAGILEKIGKYNRKELEQPALESVRDELYFLLGKYHYNKGKLQGGGLAVQHGADAEPVLRAGQAVRGRHPRARVQRQAGRRGLQGGAARRAPRATTPR